MAVKSEFKMWLDGFEWENTPKGMISAFQSCWDTATRIAEEKFTSTNRQSAKCPMAKHHRALKLNGCDTCGSCGAALR